MQTERVTDINALIGQKIGLPPEVFWQAWKPIGPEHEAIAISNVVQVFVEAYCRDNPQYEPRRVEIWPDFLHDIAAAWLLVEWMREQKPEDEDPWCLRIEWEAEENCLAVFSNGGEHWGRHKEPATAITLAFCRANGIEVAK